MYKPIAHDPEEVRRWAARWKLVNAFEIEELRRSPPDLRLRQFFSLMALGKAMGWHTSTPEEIEAVRARWRKIREAYRG